MKHQRKALDGKHSSSAYKPYPHMTWTNNSKHHYVPNSRLKTSDFNTCRTQIQTVSFLYVGTQIVDGTLKLNNVPSVTSGDLPVTSVSLVFVSDVCSNKCRELSISLIAYLILRLRYLRQIWQKLPKGSFQEAVLIGRFLVVDGNLEQPRLAMSAKAFNFNGRGDI
jgi:hypothetical protein